MFSEQTYSKFEKKMTLTIPKKNTCDEASIFIRKFI